MRKPSSSITHLVKIVAKEVFYELWEEKEKEKRKEEIKKYYQLDLRESELRVYQKLQKKIDKAGKPWGPEEDRLLRQEMKTVVAQIAINHMRSRGAIESRIKQKDLWATLRKEMN